MKNLYRECVYFLSSGWDCELFKELYNLAYKKVCNTCFDYDYEYDLIFLKYNIPHNERADINILIELIIFFIKRYGNEEN